MSIGLTIIQASGLFDEPENKNPKRKKQLKDLNDPIFTLITCESPSEDSEKAGYVQTHGFYYNLPMAERGLRFIDDDDGQYALIEKVLPGSPMIAEFVDWYQWEDQEFVKCDTPEWAKSWMGFSF